MRKLLGKALIALLMLSVCLSATALAAKSSVVQPNEDFVYLDTANVLSEATEGEIYFANKQLNADTGAMIVVAALQNIGGADTYDYAYALFNDWGIGDAKENNGFLLLMAIDEDDYYALPGAGLEGIFPASTLKNMMDQYLEPDFAKKDYDAAARKFFEAVYRKVADKYNVKADINDAVKAYKAFVAENSETQNYNSGSDFVRKTPKRQNNYDDYYAERGRRREGMTIIGWIIVLLLIFAIISKLKGGSFLFWRPTFFWPIFGPRVYPPNWRGRRRPPRGPGGFGGPRPGGFGGPRPGGFSGGSRPSGGFTNRSTGSGGRSFGGFTGGGGRSSGGRGFGGFGGGFSGGGGRSFGGGAGRGRH